MLLPFRKSREANENIRTSFFFFLVHLILILILDLLLACCCPFFGFSFRGVWA